MEALADLPPDRFEYREWVGLQWVRTYLVYEGDFPDPELAAEFERLFSPRAQVDIFAVFKLMFFANMLVNTVTRETFAEGAACTLPPAAGDNPDNRG